MELTVLTFKVSYVAVLTAAIETFVINLPHLMMSPLTKIVVGIYLCIGVLLAFYFQSIPSKRS